MDEVNRSTVSEGTVKPVQCERNSRRTGRKLRNRIFAIIFMGILLTVLGQLLGMRIMSLLTDALGDTIKSFPNGFIQNFRAYSCFIGIHILVLLYVLVSRREVLKRFFHGYCSNTWKMLFAGVLAGLICNGIGIGAAVLHGDLSFRYSGMEPWTVAVLFVAVFIQSAAEELVCRGYMLHYINDSYNSPVLAVVISGAVFSLLHVFNTGVTVFSLINIAIFGIAMAIAVCKCGSIWFAMAFHAGWNFCQAFIFGLPNSGSPATYSIFAISQEKASIMYDTVFGVEGAVTTTVICVVVGILLYLYGKNRNETSTKTVAVEVK